MVVSWDLAHSKKCISQDTRQSMISFQESILCRFGGEGRWFVSGVHIWVDDSWVGNGLLAGEEAEMVIRGIDALAKAFGSNARGSGVAEE